jgi:hypothetical protein
MLFKCVSNISMRYACLKIKPKVILSFTIMSESNNIPPPDVSVDEGAKSEEGLPPEETKPEETPVATEPEGVVPPTLVSNRPEGVPDVVWEAANATIPTRSNTPVPRKRNFPISLIVLVTVNLLLTLGFWFWNKREVSVVIQTQSQEVSKERIQEEIPESNYSDINQKEMDKLPKVQEVSPSASVQQKNPPDFWTTFFKILTDKVVGEPPVQKPEISTEYHKRIMPTKIEKSEPEVSLPATELPKKQVTSKPLVQEDTPEKVSQLPAKKIEKPKAVSKQKQTSSKIQWIRNGECYAPVKEGNIGFTGSQEPNIPKPSGWEKATWRIVKGPQGYYWVLVQ